MGLLGKVKEEAASAVAASVDMTQNAGRSKGKPYVVLQVSLKERVLETGSGNLSELEKVINDQCEKGYRLHTFSTATSGSGAFGGDRIQATLVFERLA